MALHGGAFGVRGEGKNAGPRLDSLARAVIYTAIAVVGFETALGRPSQSQARRQGDLAADVMGHTGGRVAVAIVGAVVVGVGAMLVREGLTRRCERPMDLSGLRRPVRRTVEVLGVIGTTVRGAVFAVAGVLVVQAAWDFPD